MIYIQELSRNQQMFDLYNLLREGFTNHIPSLLELQTYSNSKRYTLYGGFIGDKLCCAVIYLHLDMTQVEILYVTCERTQRHKGYAHHLVKHTCACLKKLGIQDIFLEMCEENHKAFNLYTKLGFQIIGNRKNYYRNKETHSFHDALTMHKRC